MLKKIVYFIKTAEISAVFFVHTVFLPFRSVSVAFFVRLRYNNGMYNATTLKKSAKQLPNICAFIQSYQ